MACGGGSIGAENGRTAALDIGRRTGCGGRGVTTVGVVALSRGNGCGRRPGSVVMD